jgi:hypothetical protein
LNLWRSIIEGASMSDPEADAEHGMMRKDAGELIEGLTKFLRAAQERTLIREEIAEVLRLEARARWLRKKLDPQEEVGRALRRLEAELTRLLKRGAGARRG